MDQLIVWQKASFGGYGVLQYQNTYRKTCRAAPVMCLCIHKQRHAFNYSSYLVIPFWEQSGHVWVHTVPCKDGFPSQCFPTLLSCYLLLLMCSGSRMLHNGVLCLICWFVCGLVACTACLACSSVSDVESRMTLNAFFSFFFPFFSFFFPFFFPRVNREGGWNWAASVHSRSSFLFLILMHLQHSECA